MNGVSAGGIPGLSDLFPSAGVLLWIGVPVLVLLTVFSGPLAGVLEDRASGFLARTVKLSVCCVLFALAVLPCAGSLTEEPASPALFAYGPLLAAFFYFLGKSVGCERGKQDVRELLGIGSSGGLADVQERLFESKMRLVSSSEVIRSIGELAREREAERKEAEAGKAKSAGERVLKAAQHADGVRINLDGDFEDGGVVLSPEPGAEGGEFPARDSSGTDAAADGGDVPVLSNAIDERIARKAREGRIDLDGV